MKSIEILEPIDKKLYEWIKYEDNMSKDVLKNKEIYDKYRMENDLDCTLTGNLNADTIFSLWLPLRLVLRRINGNSLVISKTSRFLKSLRKNLQKYLPIDNLAVQELSNLFKLGMTRANVMILPEREINKKRGSARIMTICHIFLISVLKKVRFMNTLKKKKR